MPLVHNDPQHWRDRASEARALAKKMSDPEGQEAMMKIAENYERLAARALERIKAGSAF
jgi:hypothetical protein